MKTRIHVVQGDITKLAVDVIVNASRILLRQALHDHYRLYAAC